MVIGEEWGRQDKSSTFDSWPKNEVGEPEEPMRLCNVRSNDFGDELLINMLEAYEIPCIKMYPGDGEFGKVVLGMSGSGADIYVPASLYEDAIALITSEPQFPDEDEI